MKSCEGKSDEFFTLRSSLIILHSSFFTLHYLLVLAPSLDIDVLQLGSAEGIDERTCQTAIGNQWHVEVDGSTTNLVTIAQL